MSSGGGGSCIPLGVSGEEKSEAVVIVEGRRSSVIEGRGDTEFELLVRFLMLELRLGSRGGREGANGRDGGGLRTVPWSFDGRSLGGLVDDRGLLLRSVDDAFDLVDSERLIVGAFVGVWLDCLLFGLFAPPVKTPATPPKKAFPPPAT